MCVKTIIDPAAGPNSPILRILREEVDCLPLEVPAAQATRVAAPKSASTV